jgi:hypothetical protein
MNKERIISESPDVWVILKIEGEGGPLYKVFASWYGGYLGSDRWKMNSGIVNVEEDENFFYFFGYSGSCYQCPKGENNYRTNNYTQGILSDILKRSEAVLNVDVKVLEPSTDFINLLK